MRPSLGPGIESDELLCPVCPLGATVIMSQHVTAAGGQSSNVKFLQ